MNPYASDPDDIPASDRYADIPSYGRYSTKPSDFCVDSQHVNSDSPDSLRYWASVITQCTESNQIYPADEGGRDVFALGSIIVKSSHLHDEPEIDYTHADSNEVQAIDLARRVLKDSVRVPHVYFSGKVSAMRSPRAKGLNRATYSRDRRSMTARSWFKRDSRACALMSPGNTYPWRKGSPSRPRHGRSSECYTLSSPPRTVWRVAATLFKIRTF